jgi:formylmethanofuran dehydrogenase subunit E
MKKDYNYIAALEKAIAEKYGKDAVQDFRSMWTPEKEKDYLSDLKEKYDKEKTSKNEVFEVRGVEIRINSIATKKERTCPVCKTYSFSGKDDLYMNRFDCCYECYVDFVAHEEQRWADGWRPDSERLAYAFRRRKNGNSARDS